MGTVILILDARETVPPVEVKQMTACACPCGVSRGRKRADEQGGGEGGGGERSCNGACISRARELAA